MSFLDKFLNVMRLNPDDDDDFYNEDYDYDDEEEEVKPKSSFKKREKEDTFTDDYKEKPVKTTPKVTPIRPSKKQQNLAGMEVCVIKPTSVEDAREITETLLNNRTVVLNVEGLENHQFRLFRCSELLCKRGFQSSLRRFGLLR